MFFFFFQEARHLRHHLLFVALLILGHPLSSLSQSYFFARLETLVPNEQPRYVRQSQEQVQLLSSSRTKVVPG